MKDKRQNIDALLKEIKACSICVPHLPLGPNPIVTAHSDSKIVIIGQAPGTKVHESGIPWNDKSGDNLRSWMGIDKGQFYNTKQIAIIPMGFCYPGKGKSGDLPPRPECAPQWHDKLLQQLPQVKLTLLIGKYAQGFYLTNPKVTLTDTVREFREYLPQHFVLPHPSPRNNIWQAKNEWFAKEVLPALKEKVHEVLSNSRH